MTTTTMTQPAGAPSGGWQRFTNWPGHSWLALAARIYLGVVFVMACWHKIANPDVFALDVATYDFLPLQLINLFALVLPVVELVAGVMLIVGYRTEAAALLVALMMVAFMIALGAALARGMEFSCGCFASQAAAEGGDSISMATMLRDGAWLGLALYVLYFDRRPLGVDRLLEGRRS